MVGPVMENGVMMDDRRISIQARSQYNLLSSRTSNSQQILIQRDASSIVNALAVLQASFSDILIEMVSY
jgi:hypothetical protein